jgi:hypothetical protein
MNRKTVLASLLRGLVLIAPGPLAAAAPAKPARQLVNIADTRALPPGLSRWIADVYNASHWEYGLLVVVVMAVMGVVLGAGFDRAVSMLGIDLGRLEHHE